MDTILICIMIVISLFGIIAILNDRLVDSASKSRLSSTKEEEVFVSKKIQTNIIFSPVVLAIAGWVMNNHSAPVDEESVRKTGEKLAQNSAYLAISKNIL